MCDRENKHKMEIVNSVKNAIVAYRHNVVADDSILEHEYQEWLDLTNTPCERKSFRCGIDHGLSEILIFVNELEEELKGD